MIGTGSTSPPPLTRRLSASRRGVISALAAVLLLGGAIRIGVTVAQRYGTNDFAHYYLSSRLLLQGEDPYGEPLAPLYRRHGFEYQERIPSATNPPPLLAALVPFAALPPKTAYYLWALLQAGALVGALFVLRRWMGHRLSGPLWWFFVGTVVVSNAVYYHFYHSQVQLLLLFLLVLGFRLQATGRHLGALLAVVGASLLKLFPAILLPWFVWKARRRRGALLITAVAGTAVVLATASLWPGFLEHGLPVVRQNAVNQTMNFSLTSLVANLAYAAADFAPANPDALWLGASAAGGTLVAGAYLACWKRDLADERCFCLLLAAAVAASLTGWPHYFVLVIPAFALLTLRVIREPDRRRLVAYGLFYLAGMNVISGASVSRFGVVPHVLLNYLPLYALLALLAWLAYGGGHSRAASAADDTA